MPLETRYNNDHRHDTSYGGSRTNASNNGGGDDSTAGAGIDRNTSVRSVMTLPAYSPNPKATEQVIGREGERAGMDSVVEFPETVDEEEMRREEQMESLYQIRQARRLEQEEREERRRLRREARNRSDWDRLDEMRRESRARANSQASGQSTAQNANGSSTNLSVNGSGNVSSSALIAEHQSRGRDRRVASVTYAEVGHVRHDGTRLRASSQDSDSRPLLDAAASMGGADGRNSPSCTPGAHLRGHSASSSIMSVSTNGSDFDQDHLPSASNISNSNPIPHTHPSSHEINREDGTNIADSANPPPEYEHLQWGDAPAYTSPVVARGEESERREFPATPAPELPRLTVLPSIEIETATPGNSAPNTPATPIMRREADLERDGESRDPKSSTRTMT